MKKTLRELNDLTGKRVLVRVDFNVPHDQAGNVTNDRRIRAALPTIRYLLDAGASAIVMSHFGRPTGDPTADAPYRLDKVAERLRELLGRPVRKVDDVVGPAAAAAAKALKPGEVLVLENLRFHPGEKKGETKFAAELAALGDVYVNDAFGACHREDASLYALPLAMQGKPRVAGFLVARELEVLGRLLSNPARPLVGIMGGAKVSDKIGFIKALLGRVDRLLVGGAMTYTFMKAQGQSVGGSRWEADKIEVARELLTLGREKMRLPVDHLVAERPEIGARTMTVEGAIPNGWVGVDIGPKTMKAYGEEIAHAGTAVWNGPVGFFELEPFRQGTRFVAETLASCPGTTIVGGGETAEAVETMGLAEKLTHVSTGGGAFLEFIEKGSFTTLDALEEA